MPTFCFSPAWEQNLSVKYIGDLTLVSNWDHTSSAPSSSRDLGAVNLAAFATKTSTVIPWAASPFQKASTSAN